MTDYHSPTVVQPNIPAADITPLERLILGLAFDAESEDDEDQVGEDQVSEDQAGRCDAAMRLIDHRNRYISDHHAVW